MKNILVLDTGKEWGGGTNSLIELLKRIDGDRYRFHVLFYNNYGLGEESDIKTEIEELGIPFLLLKQETQSLLIKILKELVRTIFFFSKSIKKYLLFFIEYQSKIKKNAKRLSIILKELDIDLLYMNNQPSSNLEGTIAANNNGIRSLLHSRIETKLNLFEIRVTNEWLTKMICNSEGVKKSFVNQGVHCSKCIVIYNGIDSLMKPAFQPDNIRQELGIENDELLIGSAGSLIKRKRFDLLIDSVSFLVNDKGLDKIKCLIIGEGPEREFLQKKINKSNLGDRIILAGFKSDALSYINAMDVFVLASEREGFSKVILEALLTGKPVIS